MYLAFQECSVPEHTYTHTHTHMHAHTCGTRQLCACILSCSAELSSLLAQPLKAVYLGNFSSHNDIPPVKLHDNNNSVVLNQFHGNYGIVYFYTCSCLSIRELMLVLRDVHAQGL